MIGNSIQDYVLIRLCIFGFRLIAPLSFTYVAASWYTGHWIFTPWLGYYTLVEISFYLFVYLPRTWLLQKVSFTSCMKAVGIYVRELGDCFSPEAPQMRIFDSSSHTSSKALQGYQVSYCHRMSSI